MEKEALESTAFHWKEEKMLCHNVHVKSRLYLEIIEPCGFSLSTSICYKLHTVDSRHHTQPQRKQGD